VSDARQSASDLETAQPFVLLPVLHNVLKKQTSKEITPSCMRVTEINDPHVPALSLLFHGCR